MEIDNKLNFSKHISNVHKKINYQFNFMLRFRKLKNSFGGKSYLNFTKRIFYVIFIIAPLSGTFVSARCG